MRLIPIYRLVLSALTATALTSQALGAESWPAESCVEAVKLTAVDSELNAKNMSGAAWNPETRTLWLANNSGRFYALVEDGQGGFKIAINSTGTQAKWAPGGDLEGICQVDYKRPMVYLMDENGWIREYDVARYGEIRETRNWDIREQCPEVNGVGPEGLTFVPDDALSRQGFRGADGELTVSSNGMGGLMFVGHQLGGTLHVFDLNPDTRDYRYVGRYQTGRTETAGLEFDRLTGRLFIWHNTGDNYLEITGLASDAEGSERRLRQMAEYQGPRKGNLEGFALGPGEGTNAGCFLTDDKNRNGEAILWFRQFRLPPMKEVAE